MSVWLFGAGTNDRGQVFEGGPSGRGRCMKGGKRGFRH